MIDPKKTLANKSRETALKDLAKSLTDYMMDAGWFNTCLNCCDWDDKTETCVKFKARPPLKVIISGCEHHTDIPF